MLSAECPVPGGRWPVPGARCPVPGGLLYNARPTWLENAHKRLDEADFAAYGWNPSISDQEILAKLLELNGERSASAG